MTASILDLKPRENSPGAATVRAFFAEVVREAWHEEKRVFGDSDWRYAIYEPLVAEGRVDGTIDEDGYIDTLDEEAADALVLAAIDELSGVTS